MKTENPVVWFEIYVDDMNRAQKFYETVFQITLEALPMPEWSGNIQMLAFPSSMESKNAAAGALVKMDGCKVWGASTIVYLQSEDCSIEEARVVAAWWKIHKEKTSIWEYGNITLAVDSEGNMFGIHSLK